MKTFHLHDFVQFGLCISLHVCVLVWVSRWKSEGGWMCLSVHVRALGVEAGIIFFKFSALLRVWVLCGGEKWNRSHLPQTSPPERAAKRPTPAAFTRLRMPLFILIFLFIQRTGLLCLLTTLFGSCYSLWRLMCCWFACQQRAIRRHQLQRRLPLSCQRSHRVENQELPQITLCFKDTWAVPCFWLRLQYHPPLAVEVIHRLPMFVFLWCNSDLPKPYERKRCVTEILFLVFLSFLTSIFSA